MTKGIPKKRQQAEQLRKKRLQAPSARAASALAQGAKTPSKAIPIAQRRSPPSGGR
jgi:hypothetical protein